MIFEKDLMRNIIKYKWFYTRKNYSSSYHNSCNTFYMIWYWIEDDSPSSARTLNHSATSTASNINIDKERISINDTIKKENSLINVNEILEDCEVIATTIGDKKPKENIINSNNKNTIEMTPLSVSGLHRSDLHNGENEVDYENEAVCEVDETAEHFPLLYQAKNIATINRDCGVTTTIAISKGKDKDLDSSNNNGDDPYKKGNRMSVASFIEIVLKYRDAFKLLIFRCLLQLTIQIYETCYVLYLRDRFSLEKSHSSFVLSFIALWSFLCQAFIIPRLSKVLETNQIVFHGCCCVIICLLIEGLIENFKIYIAIILPLKTFSIEFLGTVFMSLFTLNIPKSHATILIGSAESAVGTVKVVGPLIGGVMFEYGSEYPSLIAASIIFTILTSWKIIF